MTGSLPSLDQQDAAACRSLSVTSGSLFGCIVADPPWPMNESWPAGRIPKGETHDRRRRALPYPTMTLEQIAALPIGDLAAKDSHIYVWAISRFLAEGIATVRAWGFRYVQTLVWAKKPMGLPPGGMYAPNVEFVVVGKRGSLPAMRRVNSMWFSWPRTGKHSAKPEAFQDMVESVSPGPYLELFARRKRLGWASWGNQVPNDVVLSSANVPDEPQARSKPST